LRKNTWGRGGTRASPEIQLEKKVLVRILEEKPISGVKRLQIGERGWLELLDQFGNFESLRSL